MTRRQLLAGTGCATILRGQNKPANIVMLFTDDQRFDTVSALGHPEVKTPNMDRLVRRGITFTHACTQGGLHGAICQPSRAQLMTGRSVFRVHRELIDKQADPNPEYITFPEHLRKAGYNTFATGKWHNGAKLFHRSFSEGGNIFFGGMDDHAKTKVHAYDPSGSYAKDTIRFAAKFSSETFADTAVDFLRKRDKSRPYLLYVSFTSPHDPRMAPERFTRMFPPEKVRLPRNFAERHPFDNGELQVRDEMLAPTPRTKEEIRTHIAGYYAMIAEVDEQIGRILDAVDESPDAANTYVIWAADNGLAVGQHGLLGKQNLYDHSWRVPMVITGPGIPANNRAATLCHIMDLCPTIAELAGYPMTTSTDAKSLVPVLKNSNFIVRNSAIAAYRDVQRAIRDDRWKLILYNVHGRRTTQLFDIRNDPWEMNNLADHPEHKRRVAEMRDSLQRQLRQFGDPTELGGETWAR